MTFTSDRQGAEEQVITIAFKQTPLYCVRMLSDLLGFFILLLHMANLKIRVYFYIFHITELDSLDFSETAFFFNLENFIV